MSCHSSLTIWLGVYDINTKPYIKQMIVSTAIMITSCMGSHKQRFITKKHTAKHAHRTTLVDMLYVFIKRQA